MCATDSSADPVRSSGRTSANAKVEHCTSEAMRSRLKSAAGGTKAMVDGLRKIWETERDGNEGKC